MQLIARLRVYGRCESAAIPAEALELPRSGKRFVLTLHESAALLTVLLFIGGRTTGRCLDQQVA